MPPHPVNFPDIKECGWHSCISPGNAFLSLMTDCHATRKPKPESSPDTRGVGQLTRSVLEEDARTLNVELRTVCPNLRPKRHIALQIIPAQLHTASSSPTEQAFYIHLRRSPLKSAPSCGRRERASQQVDRGRDRLGCCFQALWEI